MASGPHTLFEDIQALVAGALLISLGVALIGQANLITGGAFGLAFLLHYFSGIGFGIALFLINVPLYVFAWIRMGPAYVMRTLATVGLLSILTEFIPAALQINWINPFYAAAMGGLLMGVGLLILFRHRASSGGLSALVNFLQDRYGWRAGYVQLLIDSVILIASMSRISAAAILASLIGVAVLNLSLAINHRSGRYMAI